MTLKVAVIGTGSISGQHLKSYASNRQVELLAVCDLNRDRAEKAAQTYKVPHVYTDYKELLANPEIEAVSICTWNNSHAEISIAALNAGKHVLVEKPLCKTVEEALEVQSAAQASGKHLMVGYVRRYAENTNVLQSFIDAGNLGTIRYAKASCLRRVGNPGGWFSDLERSGGGPVIDLGVHVIDVCWYLMGRPKVRSISANTYNQIGNRSNIRYYKRYRAADYDPAKSDVEDLANALIRFDNGASLFVDVSFTLHAVKDELRVQLFGDKGGAELEPQLQLAVEQHDLMINLQPQVNNPTFDFAASFQNEIDHFVDCCLTGRKPVSPVEDGVELMKMLQGIYESAQSGREVYID